MPWGISESAYSALDAHKIYQYRAFGVPSLGLKRGLEEDLVVAPYATALALHGRARGSDQKPQAAGEGRHVRAHGVL